MPLVNAVAGESERYAAKETLTEITSSTPADAAIALLILQAAADAIDL